MINCMLSYYNRSRYIESNRIVASLICWILKTQDPHQKNQLLYNNNICLTILPTTSQLCVYNHHRLKVIIILDLLYDFTILIPGPGD